MRLSQILLFTISCILIGCSSSAPTVPPLDIETKLIAKDGRLIRGGMKVFPANSGIKLLQVLPAEADRPTALITVIQELKSKDQNTVHKKLYEITVPAERAPLKVPVSTDYAEGQIEIVLEYPASASPPPLKAITPALTTIDPDICVICLAEGIQCCPLQ